MKKATKQPNTYFIDIEAGTETARLLDLDQLMNAQTGLFPMPTQEVFPGDDVAYRVLDLACGPGGWVLEVAYSLPDVEVVGVDVSSSMVQYAAARAETQRRRNASFEHMDVTQPLTFPDASFAYVNARFLVGFMRPQDWLPLLRECRRLLVPGGTLCLTESEWPITTSKAYETLKRKVSMALWLAKQSVSADGQEFGVTALLGRWLREAGYQEIAHQAHAVEWSAGTAMGAASYHQCEAAFALLRPFVLKMGMATEEMYDGLYEQMLTDLRSLSFCAVTYPLTVWGKTPEAAADV
jgi:ubiquinone/menaquinone biosynthesis C-methylase UbiE